MNLDKIDEKLLKQLELLEERAEKESDVKVLLEITYAMCKIKEAIYIDRL